MSKKPHSMQDSSGGSRGRVRRDPAMSSSTGSSRSTRRGRSSDDPQVVRSSPRRGKQLRRSSSVNALIQPGRAIPNSLSDDANDRDSTVRRGAVAKSAFVRSISAEGIQRSSRKGHVSAPRPFSSETGSQLTDLDLGPPKGIPKKSPWSTRQVSFDERLEPKKASFVVPKIKAGRLATPTIDDVDDLDQSTNTLDRAFETAISNPLDRPGTTTSALHATTHTIPEHQGSLFARRGEKDLRSVDQSVNLMDAQAANYTSPKATAKKAAPRKSVFDLVFGRSSSWSLNSSSHLQDIDLGPDPSNRRMTHMFLRQKSAEKQKNPCGNCCERLNEATKPLQKCLCSVPFLATVLIVLTLVFLIPYIQDKVNRMPPPTTPEPTQAPETPEPTQAPKTTPKPTEAPESAVATEEKSAANIVNDKTLADAESTKSMAQSVLDFFSFSSSDNTTQDDSQQQPNNNTDDNSTAYNLSPLEQAEFEEMLLRMVEIQGLVVGRNLTSMQDLHTPNSPQNLALTWMITTAQNKTKERRKRRRRLDANVLEEDDEEEEEGNPDSRTAERYVVAVLFFSFHNKSDIDKMYEKLYTTQHYAHVWKDDELYAHGFGWDGLAIGNGSHFFNESYYYGNFSNFYNESFLVDHYGNHSGDYYSFYYGLNNSEFFKYYDKDGNPLWNESAFDADHGFNWSDYAEHYGYLNWTNGTYTEIPGKGPTDKPPGGGPPLTNADMPGSNGMSGTSKGAPGSPPANGAGAAGSLGANGPLSGNDSTSGSQTNTTTPTATTHQGKKSPRVFSLFTPAPKTPDKEGTSHLRDRRRLDSLLHGKWMSDKDICDWNGIECDASNQVVKLILSKRRLKGSIPSEVVALENLITLDLSENHLHGTIPSEIGSLESLRELLLQENKLTGEVPSTFVDHPLLVLRLDHNHLEGPIPPSITTMMDLKELWLSHNALNGNLPTSLEQLVVLEKLHLEGNKFTGPVPDFIANAESLLTVRLHHNAFNGTIPASLCEATTNYRLKFLSSDCKSGVVCECCHECF